MTAPAAEDLLVGEQRARQFRLEIEDLQRVAVLDVGEFLAVGREEGLRVLLRVGDERRLLDRGRSVEVRLRLARPAGLVDRPAPVALGGVHDRLAVGREAHAALFLGRGGDALGDAALDARHAHVAARDERDLLAARRHGELARAARHRHDALAVGLGVGRDRDGHLLRAAARLHRVEVAVVPERQRARIGQAQEADGQLLERRHLLRRAALEGHLVHVERARLFAQVVEGLVAVGEDGAAVLAGERGDLLNDGLGPCARAAFVHFAFDHPHQACRE